MRPVLLEVSEAMLERRRLGLWRDEMWNKVLHVPPGGLHQQVGGELFPVRHCRNRLRISWQDGVVDV